MAQHQREIAQPAQQARRYEEPQPEMAQSQADHALPPGRVASSTAMPPQAPAPATPGRLLLQLQQRAGNRAVQRLVQRAAEGGPATVPPGVVQGIAQARGQGQPLDAALRARMEPAFGVDFGQVRVHTDAHADALSRAVQARAFATGGDLFFRQGAYNPGSSQGQELLAHELTHVVQQTGAPLQTALTMSQPGDRFEQEAEQVARAIMQGQRATASGPAAVGVQRQADEESESPGVLATIGGGLLGEFNEDPTFAMIGVDLGVSLIPVLDQVSDVRDIVAHLYYMIGHDQYKQAGRWVGLVFTLIGLIPEAGSVIKSASKFAIKGIGEALSRVDELLAVISRVLPEAPDLARFQRYIAERWSGIVLTGKLVWQAAFEDVARWINRVPSFTAARVRQLQEAVGAMRELAPRQLDATFNWVRRQIDELLEQLRQRLDFQPGLATAGGPAVPQHAWMQGNKGGDAVPTRSTPTRTEELYPPREAPARISGRWDLVTPEAKQTLAQLGLTDKASRSLVLSGGEDIVTAINRFHNVSGFSHVMRDYFAGGYKQEGARFVMRFAIAHFDDAAAASKKLVFEMPSFNKVVGTNGNQLAVEPGRFIDVWFGGIKYELKSVMQVRSKLVTGGKAGEFGQVQKDVIAASSGARNPDDLMRELSRVKWVFDSSKMATSKTVREDLVAQMGDQLFGSGILRHHPYEAQIRAALNEMIIFW